MNEIKKMSLATIEAELDVAEMTEIQAGSGALACIGSCLCFIGCCGMSFSVAAAFGVVGSACLVMAEC